jgi:hypothetical protein
MSHSHGAGHAHLAAVGAEPFCVGPGVSMYMQGFAATTRYPGAAGAAAPRAACVTLFFRSWVLDTPCKFAAGCLGLVGLGLLVELVAQVRARFVKQPSRSKLARHAVALACHALQLFIGYLLMLAAMIYNAELFASVICGLVLGHALGRVYGVGAHTADADKSESVDACCAKPEAGLLEAKGADGARAHAPADDSVTVAVQPAAAKALWPFQARV